MNPLAYVWQTLRRPRAAAQLLLREKTPRPAGLFVGGFALGLSALSLLFYAGGAYPPPPEEFALWQAVWGEFAMQPFLKIPAEQYLLAQALFTPLLVLAVWLLMAGTARLLGRGQVTFEQYLNLLGFSFFPWWGVGYLLDGLFMAGPGQFLLPALRGDYGALMQTAFAWLPTGLWLITLTLGGVYNALVIQAGEKCAGRQAGIIGGATFFWPLLLIALLIR